VHISSSDGQDTSDKLIQLQGVILNSTTRVHAFFSTRVFGFVYLRSPGGTTVMCRYYLVGVDTPAPSGLYARLCHAFVVSIDSFFPLFCINCF